MLGRCKKSKTSCLRIRPLRWALGKIALDRGHRARGSRSTESGAGGAATERFNPERAGAGKEIEHAGPDDPFAEAGENGSLHPIHRWPDFGLRNEKADAAGTSGDDSHGGGEGIGEEASAGVSLGEGEGRAGFSQAMARVKAAPAFLLEKVHHRPMERADPPGPDSLGEGPGWEPLLVPRFFSLFAWPKRGC